MSVSRVRSFQPREISCSLTSFTISDVVETTKITTMTSFLQLK